MSDFTLVLEWEGALSMYQNSEVVFDCIWKEVDREVGRKFRGAQVGLLSLLGHTAAVVVQDPASFETV